MKLMKAIYHSNLKDKKTTCSKLEKKLLKKLARSVDYDENYANELCPKCAEGLKDNSDYLFETGRKEKWIYLRCKNCNQVVRA